MSKKMSTVGRNSDRKFFSQRRLRRMGFSLPAAGGLVLAAAPIAHAFQIYNGRASGNNLEISLGITTSYTGLYRVGHPSALLTSGVTNPNGNDGDANFRHGLVGNTFEVLPVLDIKDNDFGMHFSGEYFLNTVYLQKNQNNQAGTVNSLVSSNTSFSPSTRQANGQNGRMLDAFVYDSWNFGDGQDLTLRAGQQSLFWGQSIFYGTNGISGGQAPIDVVAANNLVNPQTQQIYLPVGQIVATYQPNQTYTIQAYYQYQWEPYALNGAGSYFSTADEAGPGGDRIVVGAGTTPNNGVYLYKTKALTPPSQNGQFGLSVQAQYGNYDVGLFALRYDSKTPTAYESISLPPVTTPTGTSFGTFRFVYPRDIQLYGASLSTTVGATNVAGELSARRNMNLAGNSNPTIVAPGANYGGANNDALYPVGNTMTGLASFIYGSPSLPIDPGGITFIGEVEYVRVLGVTANKAELAPNRTSSAAAFDIQASPAYFEVLPHLKLEFPVSLSYNFAGNSQMDSSMNHGTGNYSVGISATYHTTWIASLNYHGYFGKADPNGMDPEAQTNADRSYLSLNLQHTF